jgi:hypothetical protein
MILKSNNATADHPVRAFLLHYTMVFGVMCQGREIDDCSQNDKLIIFSTKKNFPLFHSFLFYEFETGFIEFYCIHFVKVFVCWSKTYLPYIPCFHPLPGYSTFICSKSNLNKKIMTLPSLLPTKWNKGQWCFFFFLKCSKLIVVIFAQLIL